MLLILFSCNNPTSKKVSEIHTAIRIDNKGYVFSEESFIEINGSYYSLRQKAIYDDEGDLQTIILYKPEGKIEYQKDDLKKDKAIIKNTEMPLNQQWIFRNGKLKTESQAIGVQKVNDSLVMTNIGIETIFYELKK